MVERQQTRLQRPGAGTKWVAWSPCLAGTALDVPPWVELGAGA